MGTRFVVDRGVVGSGVEWSSGSDSHVFPDPEPAIEAARGVVAAGDCDAARVVVAHTAGVVLRRKATIFLVTVDQAGLLSEAS